MVYEYSPRMPFKTREIHFQENLFLPNSMDKSNNFVSYCLQRATYGIKN